MPSAYGSYVGGFYRSRIDISYTNSTLTQVTINVSTYVEVAEFYHDAAYNFEGRTNAGNGYGSWVAGGDTYLTGPVSYLLNSRSYTVTRTNSTQYVTVYGQVTNTYVSGYEGPSTASYTVTVDPQGTYLITYNANGGSSTPASQTKTHGVALTLRPAITRANGTATYTVSYSINYSGGTNPSGGTATKTTRYTFAGWKATNGTVYAGGASYTTNAATTMTAQWTSSSSTTSVTLPTPTRTGYTFQGWWTASTGGTKVGNGGATYTPSASITLHAHWAIIVYTVSYNANGGSGAPASQSKNHGTSVTLSSTQPTRSGYTFLGWSTNSTGTGAAYAPGATYSTNASTTLYAVWVGVQVTSLTAYRSDSSGTRSDAGTYGHLSAGWKAMGTIAGTVAVTATANDVSVTSSLSNRSGSKTATADLSNTSVGTFGGSYAENVAVRVSVTATLTVSYGGSSQSVSATRVATIPKVFRLLDALAGGMGLAIGTVATIANTFEVALTTIFNNVSVNIKSLNLDRDGETPTENQFGRILALTDMDGNAIGAMDSYRLSSGESGIRLIGYAGPNGASVYNTFLIGKKADGTNVYHVYDPEAFRSAIGVPHDAMTRITTVSQVITAASGITVGSATYAEWGRVAQLSVACSGFSATTGLQTVGTVVSGKRPTYAVYATAVTSSYVPYAQLAADGVLSVYWASAPSTSTNYVVRFIYLLA